MISRHTLNVGGRQFVLSEPNFNKIKHAVHPDTELVCPTIDRDPQIFSDYVWPYLIGYKIYLKETRKETLWRIWSDANFYQLPGLAELVQAELGPNITMTPEQKEEAIQEEAKVIKQAFTSFGSFIGTALGNRLGVADLGDKIVAELEEFNDQIRECAVNSVENSEEFFDLNPKQKLILAVGTGIYFKLFSTLQEQQRQQPDVFAEQNFDGDNVPVGIGGNWRVRRYNFNENIEQQNQNDEYIIPVYQNRFNNVVDVWPDNGVHVRPPVDITQPVDITPPATDNPEH